MRALLWVLLCGLVLPAVADDKPRVISSILPLHLLVKEIGGQAIDAELLFPPQLSPHDFQLKPSDAERLQKATAVIWIGPSLEPALAKLLTHLNSATSLYPHASHGDDAHVWLDGAQVAQMARRIAQQLSTMLPARSAYFHANAARFGAQFRAYDKQLKAAFKGIKPPPYLLLHDAFSRFEGYYGLPGGKVMMSGDGHKPGARHLVELRQQLQNGEFACVFREPQYPASTLSALLDGVNVRVLEVDPLGANLLGDAGFLDLYRQIGDTFLACFSGVTEQPKGAR